MLAVGRANAWFPGPVLGPFVSAPMAPPPPGPPPGPFAFADENYTRGILRDAGFRDITLEPAECDVVIPPDSIFDRETIGGLNIDPARHDEAWEALQKHGAALTGPDGQLHIHLGAQIFRAGNPE